MYSVHEPLSAQSFAFETLQLSRCIYCRKTSQKPDDDLICKFRKAFPDVVSNPVLGASNHGHHQLAVDPANATR